MSHKGAQTKNFSAAKINEAKLAATNPQAIDSGKPKNSEFEPVLYNMTGFCRGLVGLPPIFGTESAQKAAVFCDDNTRPYAQKLTTALQAEGLLVSVHCFYPPQTERGGKMFDVVLDEDTLLKAQLAAENCTFVLSVGAGTLTDIAKLAAQKANAIAVAFVTAASMDGYASSVAPLIKGGKKVTVSAVPPRYILIDYEVVMRAPKLLTAAGVGDLLAKQVCLLDWRLSSFMTGETFDCSVAEPITQSVRQTGKWLNGLISGEENAFHALMEALFLSGRAMRLCGSSRPASGAEHHISHYIEQCYLQKGLSIPLHGLKVGLGTLVSASFYKKIATERLLPFGAMSLYAQIEQLPDAQDLAAMLAQVGAPIRFIEVGVDKSFLIETLIQARHVRDRYTVLTFLADYGLLESWAQAAAEIFK